MLPDFYEFSFEINNIYVGDVRYSKGKRSTNDAVLGIRVLHNGEDKQTVACKMNRMFPLDSRFADLIFGCQCAARWFGYSHPRCSFSRSKRDMNVAGFWKVRIDSVNFMSVAIGRQPPYSIDGPAQVEGQMRYQACSFAPVLRLWRPA